MCVCEFFVLYRLVVVGLFLCFPGPRLLFVVNPFGCKRLFIPHINKSSNGTFLWDRIMINIPLGTNITIKVPSYGFSFSFWSQLATIWHFWSASTLQHLLVNVLRTLFTYLVSFKYNDSWEVFFCVRQISREGQFFFQKMHRQKMQHLW